MKSFFSIILVCILSGVFWAVHIYSVEAATISLKSHSDPGVSYIRVGDQISIDMTVNPEGQIINAISAAVTYDPAIFKIISISTRDSVVDMWTNSPVEMEPGSISMSGMVLGGFAGVRSPFYKGFREGNVIRMVFEGIAVSKSNQISIQSPVVLLHDGKGTMTDVGVDPYELAVIPSSLMLQKKVIETDDPAKLSGQDREIFTSIDRSSLVESGKWFLSFGINNSQQSVDHYDVVENTRPSQSPFIHFDWETTKSPYILKDQERYSYIHIRALSKNGDTISETTISPTNTKDTTSLAWFWGILVSMILLGTLTIKKWGRGVLTSMFFVLLSSFFITPTLNSVAHAADLVIFPATATFASNKPFTVDVMIDNSVTSVNAISGTISFPKNLLSISAIDKSDTIIKIWTQEPTYSNTTGSVHFEGIIFNPGYAEIRGKVISITFTPKSSGQANLVYTDGSILANDGGGTNVLNILGKATFNLSTGDLSGVSTVDSVNPLTPQAPKINSDTFTDPSRWYSAKEGTFSWTVPDDVTSVRFGYDKYPSTSPTVASVPPISSKTLKNLSDGVYYTHVQMKNSHGWGATSHYRFQIDSVSPEAFKITFPQGNTGDNPQPAVHFITSDTLSGIDHYEVKIGDREVLNYTPGALQNPYIMAVQGPGKRIILVRAIDKAGNSTTESADFTIDPITTPTITSYPKEVSSGDTLVVRGTTYADAGVDLFMRNETGEIVSTEYTKSARSGEFSAVWSKRLSPGVYRLTAQVTDGRGAKSLETSPVTLIINQKALVRFGEIAINFVSLVVLVFIVLAVIMGGAYLLYRMFTSLKKRIRKDLSETEKILHQEIVSLKEDVRDQLKVLEGAQSKRDMTKEEMSLIKALNKRIDKTEKVLDEKLSKLGKDLT